ncbi:MAG: class I SAM-dependent methyltransferase [Acidimicrobiales bacterium]
MSPPSDPYYREDLALVHHRGFAFHAEACAPGILALLEPVRQKRGLILEIGCGSGLLTEELVRAGHRVVASDASPAMLRLARITAPGAEEIVRLTLPDDAVPKVDAIIGVGHALNYLPDAGAINRAFLSLAKSLLPGGVMAIDICDLEWGATHTQQNLGRVGGDWAIISRFSLPSPDRYVRDITTFTRNDDGTWRRDDERHDNILLDTSTIPMLLASEGLQVEVRSSFGSEDLPAGLRTIIGHRPA